MPARTPLPAKPVAALVRARRATVERRTPTQAPELSAELVEIRQLRADLTPQTPTRQQSPGATPVTVTVVDEDRLRPWLWRYRHVMRVFYVAVILAASKLLILAPSFLPLIGLTAAVGLGIAAVAWLRKTSTATVLTKGQRADLTDLGEDAQRWAERLTSPRAGAVATVVCAAGWWLRPDEMLTASISLAVSAGVVAGARGWRFRIRPQPVEAVAVDPFGPAEVYRMHIADVVKEAKTTYVASVHDVINPHGERIGIALDVDVPPPSKGATALVPQVVGHATTAFGVGLQDVMTEVPRTAAGGGERRFTLTILDRPDANALEQIHPYAGSTFDPATGIWRHGLRADWTPALGQLYDPRRGGYSIHVSGETGGGKSESIELILRSVTSAGVVIPAIVDIDGSYVDWAEVAPVYVTTPEHAAILTANYSALIQHRKDKKKTMRQIEDGRDVGPLRVYPIDEAHPVWLLAFDEWQFELYRPVTGPIIQAYTKEIVTQQRKVVMPMLAAGQATGLNGGFKGDTDIRTQFQGGTMIAHRNNSDSGHQAFGGNIQVNPSKIPLGLAGALYMTSRADARDAMVRAEWVQRPRDFDHQRNIPEAPGDELEILLRGLPGGMPLNVTVIDMASKPAPMPWGTPNPKPRPVVDAPAVAVERPNLTVVNTSASDQLKEAMKAWVRELARPVQRQEFLTEFRDVRGVASRYKVDKALAEMKDAEEFEADAEGYYTLKEAA